MMRCVVQNYMRGKAGKSTGSWIPYYPKRYENEDDEEV
jgi:hypothetical protein